MKDEEPEKTQCSESSGSLLRAGTSVWLSGRARQSGQSVMAGIRKPRGRMHWPGYRVGHSSWNTSFPNAQHLDCRR
ncbi:MAG: hypothetical protein ABIJ56_20475 [Pseudomonadota bacterium]